LESEADLGGSWRTSQHRAGFGAAASSARVTAETRFPAGQLSRTITAAGIAGESSLRRTGLIHSSFAPPSREANVATPPRYLRAARWPAHDSATALWTTAPDLARFLAAAMDASAGRAGSPLDPSAARALVTPTVDAGRGMFGPARQAAGFLVADVNGAPVTYNLSYSPGSAVLMIGFPSTGAGCVVLVNDARTGPGFAMQVAQRLAVVHGWPALPR